MKKFAFLLSVIALGAAFTTCEKPPTEFSPLQVSDEVARFFRSGLNRVLIGHINNTDYRNEDGIMINSLDELPTASDWGPIEYPDFNIDFDSQSLIIGYFRAGDGIHILVDQNVIVESKRIILSLTLQEGGGPTILSVNTFGGVYPKLPNLPIEIVRNNMSP